MGEYIKRRLSQEQMRGSVQVFIKRVVMTLVGLMVLSSSILFIFVYLPLKAELEKSLLDNFDRLAYISYTALENSIDRGYDKLIFDLSKQIRMLSTEDIHLDLMYSEEYDRLYAGAQALREGERSSLLYKEADFYRVFHMRDGTYFVAQEDETTLLEPVFRLSLQTLVTSIGVLISFAVAVYFLVIRYAKRELINLEKRRVSLKKAVSKANLDALTMAGTRRFGEEYLEQVFADFKSGAPSPAILLFDIDGLKSINDNYGHSVGDLVIRAISRIVHENIRSQDMLLRWGGDEFVGCFADLDKENSLAFAQKILDLIAEIEVETGDCCIRTSISIGISYFDQEDRSFLEAINRADRAMYQSKTEGKDRANTLYK